MTTRGALPRISGWNRDRSHPAFEIVLASAIRRADRGEAVGVMQHPNTSRYHCVDDAKIEDRKSAGYRLVGRFRGETFVLEP